MTGPTRWLGVLVCLAAGCVSSGANGGGGEGAFSDRRADLEAPRCLTGVVASEGMPVGPRTWVRPADAPEVELEGPEVSNVRLLTGVTVRVCGPEADRPGAPLSVESIAVVGVEGVPARLGVLSAAREGWALEPIESGPSFALSAVPDALAAAEGSVVWVAGAIEGERIRVGSFGILEAWR